MAYNTSFTRFKSAQLQALDCRPSGVTKMVGVPGEHLRFTVATVLADNVEVGGCIAMVRVPCGFQVTGGRLAWTAVTNAVVGVGDPFCCGRLLGPVNMTGASGIFSQLNCNGWNCGVINKVG